MADVAAAAAARSEANDALRLHGYTPRADALARLAGLLAPLQNADDRRMWLERIVAALQRHNLDSAVLGVAEIDAAVDECSHRDDDQQAVFEVLDVFRQPHLQYSYEKKKLVDRTNANLPPARLFPSADSKCNLYRQRFAIVHQRVLRHELFASGGASTSGGGQKFILRSVEELLGSGGRMSDVVILGMMVQLKPDCYHLEDLTGRVELDLSRSQFHAGFFVDNCVVLVEGDFADNVLKAKAVGQPPVETAAAAHKALGLQQPASEKLRHVELSRPDATIVLANDVHLDSSAVMAALRTMFEGFNDCPPVAFVFCGSFCSKPFGDGHHAALTAGIKRLTDLICEFEALKNESHFVLVPSSRDPVLGHIVPRPPLPRALTSHFLDRLGPRAHLGTNPCALRYCAQRLVVFCEDVVEKLCRNAVRAPDDRDRLPDDVWRTLLAQSHLCPVPLHVSPVYWDMDAALRLYPPPDLVVLADSYKPFTRTVSQATVACLGSFSKNGFTFQVYFPAQRTVEDSAVSNDD